MNNFHEYIKENDFDNLSQEELKIYSDSIESYEDIERLTIENDKEILGK